MLYLCMILIDCSHPQIVFYTDWPHPYHVFFFLRFDFLLELHFLLATCELLERVKKLFSCEVIEKQAFLVFKSIVELK